ncbi:hypothetical protein DOTSEDRAFT_59752 [Dothistroma septosporum NZE10]|uniref:Cobalamin-independent methionine synthase MetE C-terminal/archaeal domain-containing protein n=1 Tax=Dothistroma septosporum (strain NZE10 / CBS 128990) TaxID=675120 RepID=N1PWC9_DOTSN|nr:hypothetical protein DOTSEDRAFT_59752 [Dothistroma septosporum NZE10]
MAPPYRVNQIRSLLRPGEHCPTHRKNELANDETIKHAEAEAVDKVVKKQLELGIRPICSGEYCRHIVYGGFFETLDGMKPEPGIPIPDAFRTDFPTTTGLAKSGTKSAYLQEWKLMTKTLPESTRKHCKITMPAPNYQHIPLKPGTAYTAQSGYHSDEEYFKALGEAYAAEIKALYDAGCRNVHVDDPHLTYFCSAQFLGGCKPDGVDADALMDLYLETHNHFLRRKPKDLHVGTHLCRGNMSGSTYWVSGSYDQIADKLFSKTQHVSYYLELDDVGRTGGFEPLRYPPKGKNVVLDLVSTKKAQLEDQNGLKAKVKQATKEVAHGQPVSEEEALESLALSPQCGFSSSSLAGGKDMTWGRMWEELMLVRDTASEVW